MMGFAPLVFVLLGAAATAQSTPVRSKLPIYCRLVEAALRRTPEVSADLGFHLEQDVPFMGHVAADVGQLLVGNFGVKECSVEVTPAKNMIVRMSKVEVNILDLDWAYNKSGWPDLGPMNSWNRGHAVGSALMNLNVSIDLKSQREDLVQLKITDLDMDLQSDHASVIDAAFKTLVDNSDVVMSAALRVALKKVLDRGLEKLHDEGACALVEGVGVDQLQKMHPSFQGQNKVHVIGLGDLDFVVNSTRVELPQRGLNCHHIGFTGTEADAQFSNASIKIDFNFSYRKVGSSIWFNSGEGSAQAVVGGDLDVNLAKPQETDVNIKINKLKVSLDPKYHSWTYKALMKILSPLIRMKLQHDVSAEVRETMVECLEDPACPRDTDPASSVGQEITVEDTPQAEVVV